jgi:hypothetical protein
MNIIKDNRIVSDKTFAWRFLKFLENVEVNDAASDEELEYLTNIAHLLLMYQDKTATELAELEYLDSVRSKLSIGE